MELKSLLKELDKFNLPKDQFVITSSAAMAVHGLREPKDIDIVVSDKLWSELASKYEVHKDPFESIKLGDFVEVLGSGSYFVDPSIMIPSKQLENPEYIDGYPYVRLETLIEFKKFGNREKDIKDVEIIESYLAS